MAGIYHYLKKYYYFIAASIASNIMLAIFTVVSIPVVIPFFQLLFDRSPSPSSQSSGLERYLNSAFTSVIEQYGKEGALYRVCIVIVLVFLLKNFFRYLALYFITPVRNGIVRDIRQDLFQKFIDLPLSYYSESKKGDLMSRATNDVQEVEWSILNTIESLFKAPIIIIGCLIFMLFISTRLTLIVLLLLAFTAFIIGWAGRSLRSTSHQAQEKMGEISAILEETLSGLRIVKLFNGETLFKQKFESVNQSYYKKLNAILYRRDLAAPISEFLGIATVTVLLGYGTLLVFKSQISPETFFAFVFAFYQVIEPSKYLTTAFYSISKGRSAMDRINEVLHQNIAAPTITSDHGPSIHFDDCIRFDQVGFTYKEDSKFRLSDVTFEVKKGQKVALVGPSGSGKSTLMDLLMRLQVCQQGQITIDHQSIHGLDLNPYRHLFGVVTQEAILFNDSIKNNIVFGQAIEADLLDNALAMANAREIVASNDAGYEYNIGDKGNKLSGGQKQRLTIARAIYKNPPILILDEATSSLDSESEMMVQQAIDNAMANRTVFIIAHRFSTIKNADKILVFDKGRLIAEGTHQDLIKKCDLYISLVKNQMI